MSKEMIFKKFVFKNFQKALNFTNLIGGIAESEGHHPDISCRMGLLFSYDTHSCN